MPPPGAPAWMVSREGSQPFGPYTLAQLAGSTAQGQVLPTDSIWHEGAPEWVPAGQLAALAPGGGQAAPAYDPNAYGGMPPAMAYGGPPQPSRFMLHVKRALGWDVRSMPVEEDERQRLVANSVDEENARRYLVWRRSVLLFIFPITALSALLAVIGSLTTDWRALTGFGVLLELLRLLTLFVLPLTAFLAARTWDRHRLSRTILVYGWLVAFLTPLLLAMFPYTWRLDLSRAVSPTDLDAASALLSAVAAASVYVTLMPAVLSLIPGVLRGCLRVKALLPESILPGWFLIASTPLYVLLFLVIFTTINQLAGNLVLMLAVFALLFAPLLYLINAPTFTRPLHTNEEIAKIGNVQTLATVIVAIGLVLMVVYAFTATVFGRSLVGASEATSWMRPWSPSFIQFPIDYLVRSMFTTVIVADLFMQMNLSLWLHSKAFAASPQAAQYDRLMSEIEEAGARR